MYERLKGVIVKNKISVIMLTYNRENLVENCIKSVLNQTFENFEYIIIDNGSTDKSGEIADKYAKIDSRIKVVHTPANSIGKGRNIGLDTATGEYIAFVDDDDTVNSGMLQFLYDLSINNEADISICGSNLKNCNEKFVMSPEESLIKLFDRQYYNVAFPGKLIKRELFKENCFLEESKFDDIYLMPKIVATANKVVYHGLNYYHFNRHDNNNSAWTTNYQLLTSEILNEYLEVYRLRTEWLIKDFPINADAWRYFEWSFMISMVDKIEKNNITSCRNELEYLKNELMNHFNEFSNSLYIKEFEKEYLKQYIMY